MELNEKNSGVVIFIDADKYLLNNTVLDIETISKTFSKPDGITFSSDVYFWGILPKNRTVDYSIIAYSLTRSREDMIKKEKYIKENYPFIEEIYFLTDTICETTNTFCGKERKELKELIRQGVLEKSSMRDKKCVFFLEEDKVHFYSKWV